MTATVTRTLTALLTGTLPTGCSSERSSPEPGVDPASPDGADPDAAGSDAKPVESHEGDLGYDHQLSVRSALLTEAEPRQELGTLVEGDRVVFELDVVNQSVIIDGGSVSFDDDRQPDSERCLIDQLTVTVRGPGGFWLELDGIEPVAFGEMTTVTSSDAFVVDGSTPEWAVIRLFGIERGGAV